MDDALRVVPDIHGVTLELGSAVGANVLDVDAGLALNGVGDAA